MMLLSEYVEKLDYNRGFKCPIFSAEFIMKENIERNFILIYMKFQTQNSSEIKIVIFKKFIIAAKEK